MLPKSSTILSGRWGDSIVYATAKREGSKVVTGDSDFKGLEDVIILG
jgi:predicted nucleic acid-binding protein